MSILLPSPLWLPQLFIIIIFSCLNPNVLKEYLSVQSCWYGQIWKCAGRCIELLHLCLYTIMFKENRLPSIYFLDESSLTRVDLAGSAPPPPLCARLEGVGCFVLFCVDCIMRECLCVHMYQRLYHSLPLLLFLSSSLPLPLSLPLSFPSHTHFCNVKIHSVNASLRRTNLQSLGPAKPFEYQPCTSQWYC